MNFSKSLNCASLIPRLHSAASFILQATKATKAEERGWDGGLGTRLGRRPGNEAGVEAWERGWGGGLGTRLGRRPGNEANIDPSHPEIIIPAPSNVYSTRPC